VRSSSGECASNCCPGHLRLRATTRHPFSTVAAVAEENRREIAERPVLRVARVPIVLPSLASSSWFRPNHNPREPPSPVAPTHQVALPGWRLPCRTALEQGTRPRRAPRGKLYSPPPFPPELKPECADLASLAATNTSLEPSPCTSARSAATTPRARRPLSAATTAPPPPT
jgi:hypothetical protein